MWGVFETSKEVHIIPCDESGDKEEPHVIDCFCFCCPECISIGEDGRLIITHNMEN